MMDKTPPSFIEYLSTILFFSAILHTFFVSKFEKIAHQYQKGSFPQKIFHLFSDVELVFGIWSIFFLFLYFLLDSAHSAIDYFTSLNFTEPAFVFVIMCMAATRPVIYFAEKIISCSSKLLPFSERMSFYSATLIVGPLLGSFITEPAAMTVTALILLNGLYKESISLKFKYATIALLFVNVSVGGTLTHFAAPPVLMVASKWNWDTFFMLEHFGYKSVLAVIISTLLYARIFRAELQGSIPKKKSDDSHLIPKNWKIAVHLFFLACVVATAHHPIIFGILFVIFLIFVAKTKKHQDKLKIKESLLVGIFLAGLICLGTIQAWWLKPILSKLGDLTLFLGATTLTSITDNAALTYLGSLVELSDSSKYSLVAGAVAGGGLTVIANAPNPAGFGILRESFGSDGINPIKLFVWAIIPTIIGVLALLLMPTINF